MTKIEKKLASETNENNETPKAPMPAPAAEVKDHNMSCYYLTWKLFNHQVADGSVQVIEGGFVMGFKGKATTFPYTNAMAHLVQVLGLQEGSALPIITFWAEVSVEEFIKQNPHWKGWDELDKRAADDAKAHAEAPPAPSETAGLEDEEDEEGMEEMPDEQLLLLESLPDTKKEDMN